MNKDYNVDDILLEIKAKKSQQSRQDRPKQNPFAQPRPVQPKAPQDIDALLQGRAVAQPQQETPKAAVPPV